MPVASVDTLKDMHFPAAGIDLTRAYAEQINRPVDKLPLSQGQRYPTLIYARTTPQAVNVRGFSALGQRRRGGSRPGLAKYIAAQPSGTAWVTQDLNLLVGTGYSPPGGHMQTSQSGRVVSIVTVSQGNVYVANAGDASWTSTVNSSGETPPLNFSGILFSAPCNQKLFFADGVNYVYYDPSINTVQPWTIGVYGPTDPAVIAGLVGVNTPKGILPRDSANNAPRLICLWRGGIVLSGLLNDPQNWFMSRRGAGDPFDFDYAPPSPSPTQAVAGNNSPAGLVGDVITSLCPYSDDMLFFGGDHTLYMLRGDPAAGGQIDLISDSIGMAWGIPWCKDPYGTLYFFSNRTGIYSMVPGQQPQRISQAIEQLIQNTDTGANSIRLVWDDRYQGLHVFITPLAAPATTTHLFHEARTGSWWQDQFGNTNLDPLSVCVFDGNTPGDRAVLLGCWDGYVRTISPTAVDDDGTPITSSVMVGPILTENLDDMLLKDIQGVLAQASGKVNYAVFVGPTAEAALAAAPVASGVWTVSTNLAGRNFTNFVRRSGHAIYIQLSSTVPWAMEQIRARIATQGKVRGRGR